MNKNIKILIENYIGFNPAVINQDSPKLKIDTNTVKNILSDHPKTKEELIEIIHKRIKETKKTNERGGTTLDLSYIDTSEIKSMGGLFKSAFNKSKSYITSIDFTGWDTSNVVDMSEMFINCKHIQRLDLSMFDTSKVVWMNKMFYNCELLYEVNLSSFDVTNVLDMSRMFLNCKMFMSIDLSHFNIKSDAKLEYMFAGCDEPNVKLFDNDYITSEGEKYRKTYKYDHMFKGWHVSNLPKNEWVQNYAFSIIK